jgi:membrane protein required for colicin V production
MNIIDLFFLLLFIGVLVTGFFQGMVRLLVLILSFYLGLVLASLYYPSLGEFFVRTFDTQRFVGQYMAFALVLFFAFLLLALAGLYTFRYLRMPGSLELVDRIVGSVLGMIFGAVLIGIFASLLWNLMIVRGGRNIDFPLMAALGRGIADSFLLRYFSQEVLPLVYGWLDPILPNGANLLFLVEQ